LLQGSVISSGRRFGVRSGRVNRCSEHPSEVRIGRQSGRQSQGALHSRAIRPLEIGIDQERGRKPERRGDAGAGALQAHRAVLHQSGIAIGVEHESPGRKHVERHSGQSVEVEVPRRRVRSGGEQLEADASLHDIVAQPGKAAKPTGATAKRPK